MTFNFTPFLISWAVMAVGVLGLVAYRFFVSHQGDPYLHVSPDEMSSVKEQAVIGRRLMSVDRWGKLFTAVTVIYGLVLGGLFLYSQWVASHSTAFIE
jgi:hypothetical protein